MRPTPVLACALLLACAGAPSCAGRGSAAPRSTTPAWKRSCEAYATGPVTFTYQDAPGGAAVLYRAPGSERGLRERAREIARFHNGSAAKNGALHDLSSIPHRASVEDIDGGAKLVLRVKTPRTDDLDRLRWNVQQDVALKQRGGCQSGMEAL